MEDRKKRYEMATIFNSEIEEADLDKHIAAVENVVTSAGGEMIGKDIWGLRTFAYLIKKQSSGYYVFYYFDAEPDVPHKIRDALMLKEDVVRHMIVIGENMPEFIGKGDDNGLLGEA